MRDYLWLLRNICVTLNSGQVGEYFGKPPPTLEQWTSQGARPIPRDCIFSPNYVPPIDHDSDDEVDIDVNLL